MAHSSQEPGQNQGYFAFQNTPNHRLYRMMIAAGEVSVRRREGH